MQITQKSSFKFSQFNIQNDGGWCVGISTSVMTHLHENLVNQANPADAFFQTKNYVQMLSHSFDKIAGRAQPGFLALRRNIRSTQANFRHPLMRQGEYEYAFGSCGIALLLLSLKSSYGTDYGNEFRGRFSLGGDNHAGVIAWKPGEAFIFDPNCGGMLFGWYGYSSSDTFKVAVDMVLERLYVMFDRLAGARRAKMVGAQRLLISSLPFGQV